MNQTPPALPAPPPPATISANDILYILFRHKWKILICTLIGLIAAGVLYVLEPPPFESDAMLFIRYVTEDSAPGLPGGGDSKSVSLDARAEAILNTELEILGSLDIAYQVVDTVGVDKILEHVKDPKLHTRDHAAALVRQGLSVQILPDSSVIQIVFKDSDPSIVEPVLSAVVDAYYKKHADVHRESGVISDFLSQETDQLRAQLQQTEDELRRELGKAGIISLDDAMKIFNNQESQLQSEILSTKAELAEMSARYNDLLKHAPAAMKPAGAKPAPPAPSIPAAQVEAYRSLVAHLDWLQKMQQQLLTEFTEENAQVKNVEARVAQTEAQKQAMEAKYPGLGLYGMPARAPEPTAPMVAQAPDMISSSTFVSALDLPSQEAYLAGLQSKLDVLDTELAQVKASAANVEALEGNISELQRQQALEETNYKYYAEHLEANRIDEALDAGRAPNIAEIEAPTPPRPDLKKFYKLIGMVAGSGLGLGLGWALLIEFYLDRSLRRPQDVERHLRLPLFLSVPDFGRNGHNKHVFHETLRDRLTAFFESKGLTHKPKMIAVTGVGRHTGVTSTATGLARSLSEAGENNVLLVDMTQTQGSAQQFCKGKACDFDQMLDARGQAQVEENLYVVGAEPNNDLLSRALPARFNRLVPKLRASDFDYIIFDMPAVNQISITPRLAQFMDMVLLIIESERTDRDIALQASTLLANSRTNVGVILNKNRSYLPSRAHHEFLGSA